jgi:O-antigen/teichoic acid export membrane protein
MDMIMLARFIPPALITVFEINKRPIALTQSLIGRHSVALMPLISLAKGSGNKVGIIEMIGKQFRFYSYAALFVSLMFCLIYQDLISVWTGARQYAGDTIMYLLVANFFFALIGYFMSNMGYALGDIKMNSLVNIIKGVLVGVLYFIVARTYGIMGILVVSLSVIMVTDFTFFSYRLYKLGYLHPLLLKSILSVWAMVVPAAVLTVWACKKLSLYTFPEQLYIPRLILSTGLFSIVFALILLVTDAEIRNISKELFKKFIIIPFSKVSKTKLDHPKKQPPISTS